MMTRFAYLTRLPPSTSGVALYAMDFLEVLNQLGTVRVICLPPHVGDSQRVRTLLGSLRRTRSAIKNADVLVVELAGRGIAEFWIAWLYAVCLRRRVFVNIHDAPTLTGGGPFYFHALDRRILQRIARLLSKTIGFHAERALLRSAALSTTLSFSGSEEVSTRYSVPSPMVLSHVVGQLSHDYCKEPLIFIPGTIGSSADVTPVIRAIAELPEAWRLVIGYGTDETLRMCLRAAAQAGVAHRVDATGLLDEQSLDGLFARATIVVRWRASGWDTKAVSGPVIRAMGRGCAVISNDRRGTLECLREASALILGDDPDEVTRCVRGLAADPQRCASVGAAGLAHVRSSHAPSAIADLLGPALRGLA